MSKKIQSAKWLRFGKLNPKVKAFIKDPKHWKWLNEHIKDVYDPKKHTINFSGSPYALSWGKLHRSINNFRPITSTQAARMAKKYNKMKLHGKKWNKGNVVKAWNGGAYEVTAHPDGTNK